MKNEEIKDIAENYYDENADWLNKNQEQDTKVGFRQGFAFALKSIDFDDLLKKYAAEGNEGDPQGRVYKSMKASEFKEWLKKTIR